MLPCSVEHGGRARRRGAVDDDGARRSLVPRVTPAPDAFVALCNAIGPTDWEVHAGLCVDPTPPRLTQDVALRAIAKRSDGVCHHEVPLPPGIRSGACRRLVRSGLILDTGERRSAPNGKLSPVWVATSAGHARAEYLTAQDAEERSAV